MTDLTVRVRTALGSESNPYPTEWEALLWIYEVDADAFYLLALAGADMPADPFICSLSVLADRIRKAIRASYRLMPAPEGGWEAVSPSDRLVIPADLFPRVRQFLMELDDKGVSHKPGKDYLGETVSEAEARFKLGSADELIKLQQQVQTRNASRPVVFKVARQDLESLKNQPVYVTHNLSKCARKVILAPTAVYRGLKRGDDAPERLRDGWAICGKPNHACDNDGKPIPAPSGMVFMVYADAQNHVFDWDWVKENDHEPGQPLDDALRFGNAVPMSQEFVLDLSRGLPEAKFNPNIATYSERGDCIFCYICDECSYAKRINQDLTVFRSIASKEVTGFKVKNVRRILKDEEDFVSEDAPDLVVSVQAILLATLKMNRDSSVKLYNLIIEAFRKVEHTPEVRLPNHAMSDAEMAEVS